MLVQGEEKINTSTVQWKKSLQFYELPMKDIADPGKNRSRAVRPQAEHLSYAGVRKLFLHICPAGTALQLRAQGAI